jgi:hypothetical protein
MASRNPNKFYDDETLHALELALRDVWQVLKAHDVYPDWNADPELKQEIAFKLMALADSGVRDPHELRNRTLEGLPLRRSH